MVGNAGNKTNKLFCFHTPALMECEQDQELTQERGACVKISLSSQASFTSDSSSLQSRQPHAWFIFLLWLA